MTKADSRSLAGPKPPRRAGAPIGPHQPEKRRANILDAAQQLFVTHGVAATTIDAIVERAGVAKGTFYHYFRSKAELLDALQDHFSDVFLGRIHARVDACAPEAWEGRLRCWMHTAVEAYFDLSALHDLLFHGPAMPVRYAMGEVSCVVDLADLLAEGARAGAWDIAQPTATAVILFHGMHGAVDEAIMTNGHVAETADLVADLAVRMVRR